MKNNSFNNYDSHVGVLNTSIASMNVGDFIIMDSALKVMNDILPNAQKVHFPTHERITRVGFKRQKEVSVNFLCGTNCLNSGMLIHRQWNVGFINSLMMKKVITLGVGWSNYEKNPDAYTTYLLKKLFSRDHLLSVRDTYTKEKLNKIGLKNVLNTSCPTMWKLTESHCQGVASNKSNSVVFTLTDYRKDLESDKILISSLKMSYGKVYFWCQGSQDYEYFKSFGALTNDIIIVPADLALFDSLLVNEDIDYVGTRLHAGIRALQHKRRVIIISVDNRAEEKKKDFNLNVIPRNLSVEEYCHIYDSVHFCEVKIPLGEINEWKRQFV